MTRSAAGAAVSPGGSVVCARGAGTRVPPGGAGGPSAALGCPAGVPPGGDRTSERLLLCRGPAGRSAPGGWTRPACSAGSAAGNGPLASNVSGERLPSGEPPAQATGGRQFSPRPLPVDAAREGKGGRRQNACSAACSSFSILKNLSSFVISNTS